MFKKAVSLSVLSMLALTSVHAFANETETTLDSMSEDALSQQIVNEADQLESTASTLNTQGVQVAADTQQNITQLSRDMREQATKPGLKERMKQALKATEHAFKEGGIYALEGVGYAGNASIELLLAPYTAGSDLVTASITGKGYHDTPSDQQRKAVSFAGGVGGVATWYTTVLEVSEASSVALPVAVLGGAGILLVNDAVCTHRQDQPYCKHITSLDGHMDSFASKVGSVPGKAIHFVGKKVVGSIIHVFHHPKPVQPKPVPVPAPAPVPSA